MWCESWRDGGGPGGGVPVLLSPSHSVRWVCFSNPSSSLFEALVVSLGARLHPLISASSRINRTGILGGRMCAVGGAIVFFNSYMSLPAPPPPDISSLHRMPFPVPAWWPRRFLRLRPKWPRTSPCPSATSRRYARRPAATWQHLDSVPRACCENDWNETGAYGAFAPQAELNAGGCPRAFDLGQWMRGKGGGGDVHVVRRERASPRPF